MTDFSNLKKYTIDDEALATIVLHGVTMVEGAEPLSLVGRHAGEGNKAYFNELLRSAAATAEQIVTGEIDTKVLSRNRAHDRELYPEFVLTGWHNAFDAKGESIPFDATVCSQLLEQLPDHIFDKVRNFFASSSNFTKMAVATKNAAFKKGKS